MPVLRRVVSPARFAGPAVAGPAVAGAIVAGLAVVGCIGLTGAALAGCSRFDAALGQQQAVVSFRTSTSTAERLQVRADCGKLPAVTAPKLPDLKKYPYALDQLTLTVSNASNAQIANLEKCLDKFPAVAGVNIQDSSDNG